FGTVSFHQNEKSNLMEFCVGSQNGSNVSIFLEPNRWIS
ncbi:uncharacterized protein METZ01_LOCUS320498, partial [marine metagenome]